MKTTIKAKAGEIARALAHALGAVPSRPSHPILGTVQLGIRDDKLFARGFDLALGIEAIAEVLETSGTLESACFPAGAIADHLKLLDADEEIALEIEERGGEGEEGSLQLTIRSSFSAFQLAGFEGDDFPEFPELGESASLELPADRLAQAIGAVAAFASDDETKQALSGVNFRGEGEALALAATDGHRLAVHRQPAKGVSLESITVPSRACQVLQKAIANIGDESVTIEIGRGRIRFEIPGLEITSRLLEASYPNYRALFPSSFQRVVTLEKRELKKLIALIAGATSKDQNTARVSVSKYQFKISASNEGRSAEAIASSHELEGEAIEIAFNLKYLRESIAAIPSDRVAIKLNENTQPVILVPAGEGAPDVIHLVMPIQLRD